MSHKKLLAIFGLAGAIGLLTHCAQEDSAFTPSDASSFSGKLTGRVVDKNGTAVSGALVTLRPGGTTTVSGDSGAYEFGSVTPGTYKVTFAKTDYRDTSRPDSVKVALLQSDSLDTSHLCYRYAKVTGSVLDSSGSKLPTATVAVEDQSATTTAMSSGNFNLLRVEPGKVRLFAAYQGKGYGTKDTVLSAGDSASVGGIRIDHSGGTVTGTVTNASGNGVSGATVTAAGGALTTTTSSDGSYTLVNVPSTTTVTVSSGTQSTTVTGVTVAEKGTTSLSPVSLVTVTAGALPTLLPGYAMGLTTDSVVFLQAHDSAGSDTSWHVLRYQWSADGGVNWTDSSSTSTWRLHPASLGWSTTAGTHAVAVRARVYRILGSAVTDSVTASAKIAVVLSVPDTLTTLHSLVVDTSTGKLSPSFDSSVTSYVDTVAAGTAALVLKATASSSIDTIKVNGVVVKSGAADTVALSADTATIAVVVSNLNAKTTHAYMVMVVRLPSIDTSVKVSTDTTNKSLYVTYVPSDTIITGTISFTPTIKDWSNYTGVVVHALVSGAVGQTGWYNTDFAVMSGSAWRWTNSHFGTISSDWSDYKFTLSTSISDTAQASQNKQKLYLTEPTLIDACVISIYSLAFTGSVTIDYVVLVKSNGTMDTIADFNKKLPETSGNIGVAKLISTPAAAYNGSSSKSAVVTGDSGTFTDLRDNQVYKYVKIGTQTWMAQNLNYRVDSSWCPGGVDSNCATYGRLYQWSAAMGLSFTYNTTLWQGSDSAQHQGICPSGWHIPSDAEWSTLVQYVDSATSGTKLKANSSLWSMNTGTDAYGFSVLPAGGRFDDGSFNSLGVYAGFWSSSESDASNAWSRFLDCRYAGVDRDVSNKSYGFSLRCLQNN